MDLGRYIGTLPDFRIRANPLQGHHAVRSSSPRSAGDNVRQLPRGPRRPEAVSRIESTGLRPSARPRAHWGGSPGAGPQFGSSP